MKLLFFDPYHLESWRNVTFEAHQPVKDESPVLVPEHPWEAWRAFPISNCVMRDDAGFRMWYETGYDERSVPGDRLNRTAYATSADGIHWEKPALGQYDFKGSTDNNILNLGPFGVHNVSVVHDDHDGNPNRRYKMTYFAMPPRKNFSPIPPGINVAVSEDGVRWKLACPMEEPAFRAWRDVVPGRPTSSDTHSLVGWIPERQRYVIMARNVSLVPYMFRTIGYSESADFMHWSEPINVLSPDEHDPWGTEFYYMTVCRYEDLYLGHLCVFHNYSRRLTAGRPDTAQVPPELAYMNQRLDMKLVYSRDLQVWRYADADRGAFLPVGESGAWDSGMVFGSSILPVDDEVWVYYGGTPMRHIVEDLQHAGSDAHHRMCGGLARMRRDGFVSLRAGTEPGEFVSRPYELTNEALTLNSHTWDDGEISIQVLDAESDTPRSAVVTVRGDDVRMPVDFDLAALYGQKVRLRVTARNADLYAIDL
ncbi:MAG: hypothetical protein CL610_08290 [Anaerolineaceae bacterium]|nr:hypothetical protein [Anaerolineaceae bacterium]